VFQKLGARIAAPTSARATSAGAPPTSSGSDHGWSSGVPAGNFFAHASAGWSAYAAAAAPVRNRNRRRSIQTSAAGDGGIG
jgi:hypothetical protein